MLLSLNCSKFVIGVEGMESWCVYKAYASFTCFQSIESAAQPIPTCCSLVLYSGFCITVIEILKDALSLIENSIKDKLN